MKSINRHSHRAAIALVVIVSALAISAYGPSSKPRARSQHDAVLAFKRCMRAHGAPLDSSSAINPYSRSFKSARETCDKLLPGHAQAKAQMLEVSECMRQHGISHFPNPTDSPPANPVRAIARSGVILAIQSSINTRSPAFKHAAAVCRFPPKGSYPLHGGGPFAAAGHEYS